MKCIVIVLSALILQSDQSNPADDVSIKSKLKTEWTKLREQEYKEQSFRAITTTKISNFDKILTTNSDYKIKSDNTHMFVQSEMPKGPQLTAIEVRNPNYSFILDLDGDNKKIRGMKMKPSVSTMEEWENSRYPFGLFALTRFFNTLPSMSTDGLKLLDSEELKFTKSDTSARPLIRYEYIMPEVEGFIVCNEDQNMVVVEQYCKDKTNNFIRIVKAIRHIEVLKNNIYTCKSIHYTKSSDNLNEKIFDSSTQFGDYNFNAIPDKDFTLSAHGLPEPAEGVGPQQNSRIYWLIGLLCVVLVLLGIFRFLLRRFQITKG